MAKVDPVTLEVMRNAYTSIADEMTAALVRTGFSTNIKDRRDCSCAIFAPTGDVVAQSELNTPVHLGTMQPTVATILEKFPASAMEAGDAIMTNMPYPAGPGHLNDVAMVAPVFIGDRLVALVANQAHHVDMGGFAPGSMPFGVTEIYQEGLQIPPVKIKKRGKIDCELLAFVLQNVRTKFETRGDMLAQLAANNVGERRLRELSAKYGLEVVGGYLEEMLNYAERRMRRGIQGIPTGRYEFHDFIEGDGLTREKIRLSVTIEVNDDSIRFDFSASDDMTLGPINCRWPSVAACVYFVMKCLVDPDLPPNSGACRPIEIITREGSVLGATYPAAVCNANLITTQRIVDILFGALLEAIPERVIAACSGTMNLLAIGGATHVGGPLYSYLETYAGGQGAMQGQDGMDGVQNHMTNTRNAPVEAIEAAYPLRVERQGLVPNSEGAGRWRGGMGMVREIRLLGPSAVVTLNSDRAEIGPWGVLEGMSGSPSSFTVVTPSGSIRTYGSKFTAPMQNGDLLITVTPGGGGWGDPLERDPEAVRWDVTEGLVSLERARNVYGVVLDPDTRMVVEASTDALRFSIRAGRK
jgi:N-methylhydantoinase B